MQGGEAQGAMHVSFTYTEEEYMRAVRVFYARAYHTRFNFLLGALVTLLGLLMLASGVDALFTTVCLAIGLMFTALNLYVHFVTPRLHYKANPKLRERYELDFSDEGILYRSKGAETRLEWGFYSKVWETGEFYLLGYGKDMFSVIPKRAFPDDAQEEAFREMLGRRLGPFERPRELPSARAREPEPDYEPPDSPPDWR